MVNYRPALRSYNMWPVANEIEAFRALPLQERWRVRRSLVRGKPLDDPRMAGAAVELAEKYRREGRTYKALMRWLPVTMVVVAGTATVFAAIGGDALQAAIFALIVLLNVADLMFNPATRPKNVARSVESSRKMLNTSTQH